MVHYRTHHVRRYGETDTDVATGRREDRGVDTHQIAGQIDERPPGIARIDRCIRLNKIFVALDAQATTPERADNAARHRLIEPKGVAYGDDKIAHPQRAGVAEIDLGELDWVDLDHRQIYLGIVADNLGGKDTSVRQRDFDFVGPLDDVIVGDDVAKGGIDDDAGPRTVGAPITAALRDIEKPPEERIVEQWVSDHGDRGGDIDHGRVHPIQHRRQTR